MSTQDPQKMAYPQTYPPLMPPCAREGCGDRFTVHEVDNRRPHGRGRCIRWGRRQRCECPEYTPEVSGG